MLLEKLVLASGVDDKVDRNALVDSLETLSHLKPSLHPLSIGLGDILRIQNDQ